MKKMVMRSSYKKSVVKWPFSKRLLSVLVFFVIGCTNNPFVGIGNDKDVEFPRVVIESPQNTDYVGRYFTVKGVASDDKAVDRVEVIIDGLDKKIQRTSGKFGIDIDAGAISNGPVKVMVAVFDKTGKRTAIDLNLTLDKDGPVITLFQPNNIESRKLVGSINFTGMIRDETGLNLRSAGNRFVIYKRGGSFNSEDDVILNEVLNEVPFQINNRFDTMSENHIAGLYTLYISFEDILGNIGEASWDIETIKGDDKTRLYIQSPENNKPTGRLMTLSGFASNEFIDIDKVVYKIYNKINDGLLIHNEIKTSYAFSEVIDLHDKGFVTGRYLLEAVAFDVNGNESNTVYVNFDFDNSLPSFAFLDSSSQIPGITPLISGYYSGNIGITLNVITPNPDKVHYRVVQNGVEKAGFSESTIIPYKNGSIYEISDIDLTAVSDGSVTIYAEVEKAGKSLELNRTFYLDRQKPVVKINSHLSMQRVNGTVIISGAAEDNLGVEKIELKFADEWIELQGTSLWSYKIADDAEKGIEELFNVIKPAAADKKITIRATDRAGNQGESDITLVIDPKSDEPVVSILQPEKDGDKISGILTVLGTISDDDYPLKDMYAELYLHRVSDNQLIAGYPKRIDKSNNGFPNISHIIDTETLDDLTLYRLSLKGFAWKNQESEIVTRTFEVNKNVPFVEFDSISASNESFHTTSFTIKGKVKDKGDLAKVNPFMLRFRPDPNSNDEKEFPVILTAVSKEGVYNVWTFNVTFNDNGSHTGFVTQPAFQWSNDRRGNESYFFNFRVTDDTGLAGYNNLKINLDNNKPEINITNPLDGFVISDNTPLNITFEIDDAPPAGKGYQLKFNDNVKIEFHNGTDWSVVKNYGAGSSETDFILTGSNTYSLNQAFNESNNLKLRLTVRDNTLTESAPSIVNIKKNSSPPFIESITIPEKTFHNGTFNITVVGKDKGDTVSGNGVKKIEIIRRDSLGNESVLHLVDYPGNSLTETLTHSFNSTTVDDGSYVIFARVTDTLNTVVESDIKRTIYIDNTKPGISITYQTMGALATDDPIDIEKYTAYLGFTVTTEDNVSVFGRSPTVRIGTTDGGDNVLADMILQTKLSSDNKKYTAVYNAWIDLMERVPSYDSVNTLHITVKASDVAGNETIEKFTIDKGDLPEVAFTEAADYWYKPSGDNVVITGTYGSGVERVFIRLGNDEEIPLTLNSGNFSHSFPKSKFGDGGNYRFRLRAVKDGDQNIVTRNFNIDTKAPVVTITDIVSDLSTGVADGNFTSGYRVSGKVTVRGTYIDNFADSLSSTEAADIKLTISSTSPAETKTVSPARISRGYAGTPWAWEYDWNTEADTNKTRNNVTLSAAAKDIAGNTHTASHTGKVSVVPYITSVEAVNSNDLVTDVRSNTAGVWGNHRNSRHYSVETGKQLLFKGFNLKQGSTNPAVTGNGTVADTNPNSFKLTPSASTEITISVNGIASLPVKLSVWEFKLLGRNNTDRNDTFNAHNYDMVLLSDNRVMAAYARDHMVAPDYQTSKTTPAQLGVANNTEWNTSWTDDYSGYFFIEGQTVKARRFFGRVDPVFYTSIARKDDNNIYVTATYDEFGGDDPFTKVTKIDTRDWNADTWIGMPPADSHWHWYNNAGIKTVSNTPKSFSNKKASIVLDGNYLHITYYDDKSRESVPEPEITYIKVDSTILNHSSKADRDTKFMVDAGNQYKAKQPDAGRVYKIDNGGLHRDIALVGSNPVIVYQKDGILYTANPGTDLNSIPKRTIDISGGAFCRIIARDGTSLHLIYQDADDSLSYAVISGSDYASVTNITKIENSRTVINGVSEGITGFNTSLTLNSSKPHITYTNNSRLQTREALRFARAKVANPTSASDWEYMIVPSAKPVNDGNTIIKIDLTGKPVILYKADDCLYIARLK